MKLLSKLAYAFLWLVGAGFFILPFGIKNLLAQCVAGFWFHVLRFRRKIVLHNLSLVFPRKSQESMHEFRLRCERLARANFCHVVLCWIEIFERFHWTRAVAERRVRIHGREHLDKARTDGFFCLTAHLGNWELITMMTLFLHAKLAIVTKFLRNRWLDDLWVASRRRFGLELLEERGSGRSIVQAIRRKKAVGFVMDQHTGEPHGIEAKFFGLRAWCPKGLAILSVRLAAPIVPGYIIRARDGTFDLHIDPPLEFPELAKFRTESGALSIEGLRYHVQVCNENMERWILTAPEQYLWLHRRFKNILDYRSPLVWQS